MNQSRVVASESLPLSTPLSLLCVIEGPISQPLLLQFLNQLKPGSGLTILWLLPEAPTSPLPIGLPLPLIHASSTSILVPGSIHLLHSTHTPTPPSNAPFHPIPGLELNSDSDSHSATPDPSSSSSSSTSTSASHPPSAFSAATLPFNLLKVRVYSTDSALTTLPNDLSSWSAQGWLFMQLTAPSDPTTTGQGNRNPESPFDLSGSPAQLARTLLRHAQDRYRILTLEQQWSSWISATHQDSQEAGLRLLFSDFSVNHSSVATFWVSGDGRIRRVNHATCRMMGYSESELLGMHKFQLRSGVLLKEWDAHWETLRLRKAMHFETQFRHRNGHEFPVDVESNFVEFNGTEYIFFFARDITDRKRNHLALMQSNEELEQRVQQRTAELEHANLQLRESEQVFRSLVETLPQLVWSCLPDGRCDYLSPQWVQYTAIPEKDQLGYGWALQLHPDDRDAVRNDWLTAVQSEQPLDVQFRIRRYDGVYRWFKTRALPLRDMSGKVVKWFGTNTDVDDLRRAESQAVASLVEKETLLKEIHHRVKNNMQLISSLLQLQSSSIRNPEALSIFKESQNRVRSMALIHEKLYRTSSLSEIDFAQYIRSLVSILTAAYATNPDHLQIHINADVVELEIDLAIPIALILNELISNCLKHAFPDNRRGSISVHLQPIPDSDREVILSVQDDGVGLPDQLDWANAKSLGLYLVRILTEQIDGSIQVESQGGLTVTLTFRALKRHRHP